MSGRYLNVLMHINEKWNLKFRPIVFRFFKVWQKLQAKNVAAISCRTDRDRTGQVTSLLLPCSHQTQLGASRQDSKEISKTSYSTIQVSALLQRRGENDQPQKNKLLERIGNSGAARFAFGRNQMWMEDVGKTATTKKKKATHDSQNSRSQPDTLLFKLWSNVHCPQQECRIPVEI